MEKTITVRRTSITFSLWDLGGQREFVNMLPLVCNDAVAILFMFDLSRKSTLNSVKEWYRQARGFNKVSFDFIYNFFGPRLGEGLFGRIASRKEVAIGAYVGVQVWDMIDVVRYRTIGSKHSI